MTVVILAGCETPPSINNTMNDQYNIVAQQAEKFQQTQPAPTIDFSNTRQSVIDRIERWNDPNKISYIYLINYGRVMAFYTVKGSVECKQSYLFPVQSVYKSANGNVAIDNPDIDGTYGDNNPSIFFFTTEDVYVEWSGDYMWVDQPLQMTSQPELVYTAPLPEGN